MEILTDTPWAGLIAGKVDTRRIDANGKWNFFWAVMPPSDPALVLKLADMPSSPPSLPKLRNLEIKFRTLPGGPILFIRLRDLEQLEIFRILCEDVVSAAEEADSEGEALQRSIGRTFRWHYLLKGRGRDVLGEDEQKGLIAELQVLKSITNQVGALSALEAWKGPSGAPKDFELPFHCLEVKARRGAAQPYIKISSEFQLSDVPGYELWLVVFAVNKTPPPDGRNLTEYVNLARLHLEASDPSAIGDFEAALAEVGFDPSQDYSAWTWAIGEPDYFEVTEDFPRIKMPVSLGVSNVTYALAIAACQPHSRDWEIVKNRVFGECNESG